MLQPAEGARERAAAPVTPEPIAPLAGDAQPVTPAPTAAPAQAAATPAATPAPAAATTAQPTAAPAPAAAPTVADDAHVPSYEASAVVPHTLREEDRIGTYGQPRWSARRRFPTTRMYVVPAGTIGLEYWLESKVNLEDPADVRNRSLYEIELGLGHRLQADVYLQTQQERSGPWELHKEKLELRWALADWGVIPLNPTLYVEFARENGGPPLIELKALIGDELAPRWHWGFNVVWEHQLGALQENESALTTGVSYSLLDEVFAIGAEVKFETVDIEGDRFSFENWELLAGPSLSWSPVGPIHLLFVALIGNETEGDEHVPIFQPTMVLGFEL
jgi:hypothetical protein